MCWDRWIDAQLEEKSLSDCLPCDLQPQVDSTDSLGKLNPAIAPRPKTVGDTAVQRPMGGRDVGPTGACSWVPQAHPVGLLREWSIDLSIFDLPIDNPKSEIKNSKAVSGFLERGEVINATGSSRGAPRRKSSFTTTHR